MELLKLYTHTCLCAVIYILVYLFSTSFCEVYACSYYYDTQPLLQKNYKALPTIRSLIFTHNRHYALAYSNSLVTLHDQSQRSAPITLRNPKYGSYDETRLAVKNSLLFVNTVEAKLHLYNHHTGQLVSTSHHDDAIYDVIPAHRYDAYFCTNEQKTTHTICLENRALETHQTITHLPLEGYYHSLSAVDHVHDIVGMISYSTDELPKCLLLNAKTLQVQDHFLTHASKIKCIPQSNLYLLGYVKEIVLRDIRYHSVVAKLRAPTGHIIQKIAIDPTGKYLAYVTSGLSTQASSVFLCYATTLKEILHEEELYDIGHDSKTLDFSTDSSLLAVGSDEQKIVFF